MAKLTVNRDDLEMAFDISDYQAEGYLDTQTGQVIVITEDISYYLNDDDYEANTSVEDVLKAIESRNGELPDWIRSALAEFISIKQDTIERYLELPPRVSSDGYADMENYIASLSDPHLKEVLSVAIEGKGAFPRFKDMLFNYPDTRTAWFEFERQQKDERMLAWLRGNDIDAELV